VITVLHHVFGEYAIPMYVKCPLAFIMQVSNALSGSTTEETGEEIGLIWSKGTETQPHEQKVDALNSQLKDFIGLNHSAGENGNPDTILSAPAPSKAARTPLPIGNLYAHCHKELGVEMFVFSKL
jgi:hypothetical protein